MSDDLAVAASDLVKTYPGGVTAVDGVSLAVRAGTVFGLLGPNGAGKSTTVKILTTLTRADSGTAAVAGLDVARRPDAVRRAIGCVFQQHAVDAEATGRENLQLQGHLYGLRGAALRARTAQLLDRFELTGAAGRLVRTWSGGMQRKLDVAMGLVHRPAVLFLDEPTTGLDPQARADLWAQIGALARDEGLTVLLSTHYLEEADRLADRLVIVDRGRVVVEGTPDRLKAELRGDALTVELAAAGPLPRLAGLRELSLDGRVLRARVDDGARAVPAVLAGLEAAGLVVASVTVSRPSLDDVYLRHTGRSYAAEAPPEPADRTPEPAGAGR